MDTHCRPPQNARAAERRFHRSRFLEARIHLLQGNHVAAAEQLGDTSPPVSSLETLHHALAWCFMHSEISMYGRDYGAVRHRVQDARALLSQSTLKANPLYEALFVCQEAEAMRRQGALGPSDVYKLVKFVGSICTLPDERFRFVEYAALRTVGLHIASLERGYTSTGYLDQAKVARQRYMTIPDSFGTGRSWSRTTYRSETSCAEPDIDKLHIPEESPTFIAVMGLPDSLESR